MNIFEPHTVVATPTPHIVVVREGVTLWSIASRVSGDDGMRDVIDRVIAENHLSTVTLTPGLHLLLRE